MTLPSGLNEAVSYDEELARFIFWSNDYNTHGAKPSAFMPDGAETSVFRHGASPLEALRKLGNDFAAGDNRTVRAAAIINAAQVRAEQLSVESNEPPPRHALILGWATDADPAVAQAAQKEQAAKLAERAVLVLYGPAYGQSPA